MFSGAVISPPGLSVEAPRDSLTWIVDRRASITAETNTLVKGWDGSVQRSRTSTGVVTSCVQASSSRPLEAGQWVGRYVLRAPIGAGAQAVVWRAIQDRPVVREVALKILNRGQRRNSHRQVARLRREAERGMRLQDAAILPAYEFGDIDGIAYMVMPLVRGCTLREVIQARSTRQSVRGLEHPLVDLEIAEYRRAVIRLLIDVARSLQVAHDAHVAHRDVKPSNILLDLDASERAYLIDFGMARDLDVATLAQLRDGSGTPLYMSPEKLQGRQVDEARCDVYAFGVTLHEALTLRVPFEVPRGVSGPSLMAYLALHPLVRRRLPGLRLSPMLEQLIDKAMHPHPENRHASAATLADALETVLIDDATMRTGRPPRRSAPSAGDAA